MNKLRTSIGVLWVNTICTLRCKRCITLTPYQKNPMNFPKERICRDIDAFFSIYEWVDHFDMEGGETLLHGNLPEIIRKAFEYRENFGRLHILTNGTLLPGSEVMDVCREYQKDVFFIIDDYGPSLSRRKKEITRVFENNGIAYRVDVYHGEGQYCGGWVDFGDMKHKNYSREEQDRVFRNCRQAHCGAPYIKNGGMYLCSIQAAGIGHIQLKDDEYVDFCSGKTTEEMIALASRFGSRPTSACAFCKGFDVEHAQRYAAAEQIEGMMKEEDKICL